MLWLMFSAFAGMSVVMLVAWAVQRAADNGGWTDVFWTFGVGLVGATVALAPSSATLGSRQMLVAGLIALWALRLGVHILNRVLTRHEDARYAHFRTEWAPHFQRGMLLFLQVQALAAGLLLIAVIVAARSPGDGLRATDFAGGLILVVAILGEGVADHQLRAFAARPENKGKVCDLGFWAWSRHPNYFFEWFGWLAYPFIAIDLWGHYMWGWVALLAPAYMYWLLRYVSGVPPLEEHMLRSRGAVFRAYQARTNVFFPMPPKPQEST